MKRFFVSLAVGVFVSVLVYSCSQISPTTTSQGAKGEVQLLVNLGKVGALAKSAAITLDSLTLDFTATGENPIHKMIPISESGQQIANLTLSLACKQWTVNARTWDGARTYDNVHGGTTIFTVVEGANLPVSLSLDARFSMLMVRINPVPDSATYMALYQDTSLTRLYQMYDDTIFTRRTQMVTDTAKLYYDWLPVSMGGPMMGGSGIQVVIRGIWNGRFIDLYHGNLMFPSVVAGVDASYTFNLNWIGPSNKTALQQITATAGRVATVIVDGKTIPPLP